MDVASLLDGMRVHGYVLAARDLGLLAAGAVILTAAMAVAAYRSRRRQWARARAARLQWGVHDLKERLRLRLAESGVPFAAGVGSAPTIGAWEVLEADIEAVARTVLVDAGGRRGKAKHLLRQRLNGDGTGKLNGSEAGYWRQLGALSLLDNTRDALKAYSRAADLAPDDPQAHLLLGVVSLRAGRLETAEVAFRRYMELAGNGPARHRAGTMLGDVLASKGDREAALAAYEAAQREGAALAQREPENPAWQRDLSITHDRIGDMLLEERHFDLALESYRSSLAIAEALAKRDPTNVVWQRDLSVAHDRVGDALERKGDWDGALASFRTGLSLAEKIAERERERTDLQWDVSISLDRVGDVLLAKGKPTEALAAYRRGLEIAQVVAPTEPARTEWQRDLAVSYHKVGSLEALGGNESEARELFERGRAIIARLDRIAAYQAQWRSDLAKFDHALGNLGL